ncbi:MAG TPA: hypothetical protein VKR21_16585 [Solirubrobacteraceae bacterium]|nr:hypothetical protein [Solirubrobacteraceae bacterium]
MTVRKTCGVAVIHGTGRMSRLRLIGYGATVVALCCAFTLAKAAAAHAAGEATTYTATETVPVPPASNFAGSGGGDGWAVALSNTQVFNVFHHEPTLTVACHNQSDASPCWTPRTITDQLGHDFATSGHPGMYFDPNTNKLYVYATRSFDSTAGVVCIDTVAAATNPNPFCGYTPLTPVGQGPIDDGGISGTSVPMQVGNKFYSFNYVANATATGAENHMLCFDLSTDTACAGQPYAVALPAGAVFQTPAFDHGDGFPVPATAAIGSELIVPVNGAVGQNNVNALGCMDANTDAPCGGAWPVTLNFSYVGYAGSPFPMLNQGNPSGVCTPSAGLPSTPDDHCFDLNGNAVATPANMSSAIPATDSWNGPAVVVGDRVYVAGGTDWTGKDAVYCYDFNTSASCANFPKSFQNLSYIYTTNADPQRPTCIWVNADEGTAQIQNFDAFTGGACGQGPIRALASQFVASGSNCVPASYNSLQIVSPARNTYSGGSVHFEDGDGNPIPGVADRPIDSNGNVDLTGLNLNTSSGLPQFLITLDGASATNVVLKLSWNGPYDASCVADSDGDTSASNPAITASGSSVSATEGQAFSGAVATFSDPDVTAKASDYSASINWGDGKTSSGTISGTPSKFTVNGTHTYAEEGSFHATVTITDNDGSGNNATVTDTAKVADAALHASGVAPTLSGTTASGKVATFTDSDSGGTVSDYTATINWGDGSTTTGTVSKATSGFAVSGSHTYANAGSYTITTTIKDKGGASAKATVKISAQVKAAKVKRGSAHVAAVPTACVRSSFTMQVRGTQIASVRVTLDGRAEHTRAVHRGKLYTTRMAVSPGRHAMTVHVKFKSASKTKARTIHRTVSGCTPPSFTG